MWKIQNSYDYFVYYQLNSQVFFRDLNHSKATFFFLKINLSRCTPVYKINSTIHTEFQLSSSPGSEGLAIVECVVLGFYTHRILLFTASFKHEKNHARYSDPSQKKKKNIDQRDPFFSRRNSNAGPSVDGN